MTAEKGLDRARTVIKAGGIIAYPTETFYGIGVDPANHDALKRLFDLKGRPKSKAIPLIAGSMEYVISLTGEISPIAARLIDTFWPGPLTLIFRARADTPPLLTGDSGAIGIRISSYPLCKKLTKSPIHALTSTSANPAGNTPALEAGEIEKYFQDKIDLILDGGRLRGGPASTVVDVREKQPRILREGVVTSEAILKALE